MSIYMDRPMGICCVYLLIFPDWKLYVGYATGDPRNRWDGGTNYQHNPKLQQAIKDAGWENIKKILLVENVPLWQAWRFERYFIRLFDTMYPNGFNMNSGGRKGFTWCAETLDLMRAASNAKPIDQIDPETGVILYTWPSIRAAAKHTKIYHIGDVIRGHRKKAGDYYWQINTET